LKGEIGLNIKDYKYRILVQVNVKGTVTLVYGYGCLYVEVTLD